MSFIKYYFIIFVSISVCKGLPANSHRGGHGKPIPAESRFVRKYGDDYEREKIYNNVKSWSPEDKVNVWELSGLWEGDIMENPGKEIIKNGLMDEATRWPSGIVPVFIQEEDFDQEDIAKIKAAMEEYHLKTCLRFRSYNESDKDYIVIQGSEAGCWSSVGKQGKGQVINLQNPGCVKHGTIVHEILHAVGFYHQQSSFDRDEYVKIVWENIQKGKEHNFKKYNKDIVTDYGVGYDYGSIMHYSSRAFSDNGEATIVPLKEGAEIGQRSELSEKDISKLQAMYKTECKLREEKNNENIIRDYHEPFQNSIDTRSRLVRSYDGDSQEEIYKRINEWTEENESNVWELSGLLEGDILMNEQDMMNWGKAGVTNKLKRWPDGIVPFRVKDGHFDSGEVSTIKGAMEEIHDKTCVIFRPYNETEDKDYVSFQSSKPGCWSSVGRQSSRQAINLQRPKCIKHGSIIHELMHTIGFHHQHSVHNRDDFIEIVWENIKKGKEKNFKKYDENTATDFGIGYDYQSIMHYSRKVFSANGKHTILPLQPGVKIGQRLKLSDKDVARIKMMYKEECENRENKTRK